MSYSSLTQNLLRAYFRTGKRGFYTLNRLLNQNYPELQATNRYGAKFILHPAHYIDSAVLREGYYESEIIDAIESYLTPAAVFWDIGANFGLHGITLKVLHPEVDITLFDPLPKMGQRIHQNAELNEVHVEIVEAGLLDTTETLPLYTEESGTEGESSFIHHGREKLTTQILAQCYRADSLIESGKLCAPTIIKLDVEGAEARALKGFGKHLSSPTLKAIVFEAETSLLSSQTTSPIPLLLDQNGFKIEKLTRREQTKHNLENYIAHRH